MIDTAAIRADGRTPAALDGAPPVWTLNPGWQAVDFVSDLHLAEDTPVTTATFSAYLQHTTADAVLLLGDIFEVWVGDDCLDEPDSFEARCATTLAQTARQRCVGFMAGNRDFLLGTAACKAIGLRALPDPTLLSAWGLRTLIAHGDAWCLDDIPYQRFREQVRSPQWQQAFLARPLAERRAIARQLRTASESQKHKLGASAYADLDATAVDQTLHNADAQVLVHGHTHRPARHELVHGRVRQVLSDWHCEPGPAPRRAEVLRWTSNGFTRLQVDEQGRTAPC